MFTFAASPIQIGIPKRIESLVYPSEISAEDPEYFHNRLMFMAFTTRAGLISFIIGLGLAGTALVLIYILSISSIGFSS